MSTLAEREPVWVVQTNLVNQAHTDVLARAVLSDHGSVMGVKVIPFVDDVELPNPPATKLVIPYGSTKLSKLAKKYDWQGLFFNDNFNTVEWNKQRKDMLNQDAFVMTVEDAMVSMSGAITFEKVAADQPFFIRPIEDLKAFAGTLTTAMEISKWMGSTESGNFSFDKSTMVSIAPPKQIYAEWRWFIVDGQVIDGSVYRVNGHLKSVHVGADDVDVIREAQGFADEWLPHENCVMDLALTPAGMKVIEFNCLNSSGFYQHDVPKVIEAVHRYMRAQ